MTRKRLIVASVVLTMILTLFLASCGTDTPSGSMDEESTIATEADETDEGADSSETESDATTDNENLDESESDSAVTQTGWSASSDCTNCHTTEAAASEDSSCLSGYHMTEQGFTCTTCHSDIETLAEVHADVEEGDRTPRRLKSTEVDSTLCTTCHDEASLAEATADSTVLTDAEGTVVNPHDLTENETHLEAATTCVDCHSGHDTDGIETTAMAYCTSCHHENVFECYTCH